MLKALKFLNTLALPNTFLKFTESQCSPQNSSRITWIRLKLHEAHFKTCEAPLDAFETSLKRTEMLLNALKCSKHASDPPETP